MFPLQVDYDNFDNEQSFTKAPNSFSVDEYLKPSQISEAQKFYNLFMQRKKRSVNPSEQLPKLHAAKLSSPPVVNLKNFELLLQQLLTKLTTMQSTPPGEQNANTYTFPVNERQRKLRSQLVVANKPANTD